MARQAAVAAGIVRDSTHYDDRHLERLINAWKAADAESRAIFQYIIDDGEELIARRRGPSAIISEGAPPVLVKLRVQMSMNDLAKALGVSRETVRRWCTGKVKPQPEHLASMQAIAEEDKQ